jgi:3-hydroxyisobutyrate dehydrogenase-like beta-hydroxyacid dehydrogenase
MPDKIGNVAFIGLGRMGAAIANNILEAGFDLTVHNRTPSKMEPLIAKGAVGASSPREAVAGADFVVTCLLDDESVLANATGEDGILAGLKPGRIHIGTTTVSPGHAAQMAQLHAEHGSYYVAGPVVGRPDAADTGELLTYVAGDPDAISRCDRLFDAYTMQCTNLGTNHSVANSVKLAINYTVISLVELMGQVYAYAEKSEIDLELMEQLFGVIFGHPAIKQYMERIRTRTFDEAGFELISGFKDVQLMLQASTDARAPLNYGSTIREKFITAIAHGMEYRDWSAIYEVTRMNAGLE